MDKIRYSGVAWLGDIPDGWEVSFLAQVVSQVKERNVGLREKNLLSLSYGKIKRKPIDTIGGLLPATFDGYNVIAANDIVLRLTDLQNDQHSLRVGLSHERGIITSAYITLRPSERVNASSLFYLLYAFDTRKGFYGMGAGVRQSLKYDEVKVLPIVLPPLSEQRAIADYLDEKCGAIDMAVAEAKKGIEEYKAWKKSLIFEVVTGKRRVGFFNAESQRRREAKKMKHSGIPWIGAIPERWKLARLKNCAKVFGRIGFRGYTTADIVNESEGALSLSPSNLKDIRMDYAKRTYISWSKYEESPEIKVCKGDIVFVKTGSSYGKACIVDDMPCEATLNPQLVVLKCFSCHNRYLNYYLQTPLIKYQVELIVSGGTIPTMSQEKMECWKIILPPLSEQQAIADYLDKKCSAIDAMIAEKEALIAELEAYKKSLIFEVVTGKWEVK